jgi:hypothetical protein
MDRLLLTLLALCLLTEAAHALPSDQTDQSPAALCTTAIAAAERGHDIPPQLMAAIGRVESGRRDPGTGEMGAWPWTINAEGAGSFFDNKADAIKAVLALQARGVHSIDVGCMQVNLVQHPSAFATLDMAFEPGVNADYAARFLVQLHSQTGDWVRATADYHSGNPWEGNPYAAKVTSIWPEEQRKAGLSPPAAPEPGQIARLTAGIVPFPAHQPPKMLAMAVARSGMTPPGMVPPGTTTLAMMQTATTQSVPLPGQIARPMVARVAMGQSGIGSGRSASNSGSASNAAPSPGRGLDSYRATPVAMVMLSRLTARMPFGVMMR